MVTIVLEDSSNSSKAPHVSSTHKGSELADLGEGSCSIGHPSWGRTLVTSLIHSYVYYFKNTPQSSPAQVAETSTSAPVTHPAAHLPVLLLIYAYFAIPKTFLA